MHSLNCLKGVRGLKKVDRLGDKLNTQLFIYANVDRCHVQRWTMNYHKTKCKNTPLSLNFPITKDECLFFIFSSSKRVINTRCSSSEDESILIHFTNQRKEGFIPRKGPSLFHFMSPMKENSFVFSCLDKYEMTKKTLGWNFS